MNKDTSAEYIKDAAKYIFLAHVESQQWHQKTMIMNGIINKNKKNKFKENINSVIEMEQMDFEQI